MSLSYLSLRATVAAIEVAVVNGSTALSTGHTLCVLGNLLASGAGSTFQSLVDPSWMNAVHLERMSYT